MEGYQKELSRIKTILRDNPKGMTVTDISREMDINRNSVAKYLDILLISGHAEMITFGPAKVFFPSRRVPISSVLNFVSDYVLVVDRDLKITQINDTFLEFLDIKRDDLLGDFVEKACLPIFAKKKIIINIKETLNGKEFSEEVSLESEEGDFYFKLRLIPTTFEDGGIGVTIIIANITEKKRIEHALRGTKEKLN